MADAGNGNIGMANGLQQVPEYQQLLEDLHALQQQNLVRDQQIQQLLGQLGPNHQHGGHPGVNDPGDHPQEGDPAPQNRNTAEERRRIASSAGRRTAIMHAPWMEPDFLFDHRIQIALPRIMEDVRKASLDPNDPEAGDEVLADNANPSLYWAVYRFHPPDAVDMVREILFHMPPRAGRWWFKSWFKPAFLTGYRKIRSDIVFHIAKNHLLIFGIATPDFRSKRLRTEMEDVAELLRTFQFRFVDGRPNIDSFFKHPCIMKTIRYIYSGESAIATGIRSLKARHAHSEIWQATEVTPSVIALAVTAIQFVLSGESSFERSTANFNYLDFYYARLRLMEAVHEEHPDSFHNLIMYFNRSVLPALYPPEGEEIDYEHGVIPPPDAGMTQSDVAFMEGL
ncbi:hypothetical protein RhiJN_18407 [Ceratobasidium sp. AG-Ba]|nr:hypothetical protein RhiJN_18399 [Ceratobasidium sp. AG-Ba]QRV90389.1 hypothetical protein RhiJN_18407 [Ceratobasidium sp. AG-Ba]